MGVFHTAMLQGLRRTASRAYAGLLPLMYLPQVVDDAHATLVCGERGGGAAEMLGVSDQVDLHVGTLRWVC